MEDVLIENYSRSIMFDGDYAQKSQHSDSKRGNSGLDNKIEHGPKQSSNMSAQGSKAAKNMDKIEHEPREIDEKLHKDHLNMIALAQARYNIFNHISIRTMNDFYRRALHQIITELFVIDKQIDNKRSKTAEDMEIEKIYFKVKYTNVRMTKPVINTGKGKKKYLWPQMCRDSNMTYSSPLYLTIQAETSAVFKSGREEKRQPVIVEDVSVGNIPIMLRSEYCTLHGCSKETLMRNGEDPTDQGGYFIIEGIDRVLSNTENLVINKIHVYKNEFRSQKTRLTFQSKPGDGYEHSYYMTIILHRSGEILIELTFSKAQVILPFYVMFRALGMTMDRDIIENITYSLDKNDKVVKAMLDILFTAFMVPNSEYKNVQFNPNPEDNLLEIVKRMDSLGSSPNLHRDPNAKKLLNHFGYKMLDDNVLPHVGTAKNDRIRKAQYLGYMIHVLLLRELDVIPDTDRDHCQNKTIATPSINLAKAIKTVFNVVINRNVREGVTNAFNNNPWREVNLAEVIKSSIKPQVLEKFIIRGIKSGEKNTKMDQLEVPNRITGNLLLPKNKYHILASLNNVRAHGEEVAANSNERSQDMRMPHSSFLNYIGPSHTADTGESIGLVKQIAIMATLTEGSNSFLLKEIIYADPDLIRNFMPREIGEQKLWKVLVNGDWIGVCRSRSFIDKFLAMRRKGKVDRKTIIVAHPIRREITFRTDPGHFIVPYIIVYNNISQYIKARQGGDNEYEFKQWINLTFDHVRAVSRGELTIDDLVEKEIMEYISPEESDNILLCENLNHLRQNRNNVLKQYTHLDIEPALYGILELSAPYSNFTMNARVSLFINQKKQSAGWPMLNWFNRYDRHTHLQFYCELPSIMTLTTAIPMLPTSQNVIAAYMINTGYNQEDSIIVNKSSVDRGMFVGDSFYFEKAELDKGEQFGNPNFRLTINNKVANSENIVNGFVREGAIVNYGDVLIVKTAKINKDDPKNTTDEHADYKYIDTSVIYKSPFPSLVEKVTHLPNSNLATVKLRNLRKLVVGDKLSSQHGGKGIVGAVFDESMMPYTEDGIIPDLIVNPHSIPTRMAIGQMVETAVATLAAKKGLIIDGTPFKDLDIDAVLEELSEKYGVKNACKRRMYNGRYGNWYDSLIFIGPVTYQRLIKFVIDEAHAMNSGPTDATTRQPVEGKAKGGGLRLGEMEKDALITQGVMSSIYEIMFKNSDGIDIYVCKTCRNRAVVNERKGIYKCLYCQGTENIYRVPSAFSANLFLNRLESMHINTKIELDTGDFKEYQ